MTQKWPALLPRAALHALVGTVVVGALAYGFYSEWNQASVTAEAHDYLTHPEKNRAFMSKTVHAEYDRMTRVLKDNPKLKPADLGASYWLTWAYLLGLIASVPLLLRVSRGFFDDYANRGVFVMFLTGIFGGYFAFLVGHNAYPMGIDLAGGTELIYRLNFSEQNEKIVAAREDLAKWKNARNDPALMKQLTAEWRRTHEGKGEPTQTDLEAALQKKIKEARQRKENSETAKDTAPEKAAEIIRRRIDPTGAKGIPVTSFDDNRRLRIQLPRATDEEVAAIQNKIKTQGKLTLHLVANPDKQRDLIEKVKKSPHKRADGWEMKELVKKNPITGKEDPSRAEKLVIQEDFVVDGSHIDVARARISQEGGWQIDVTLDASGGAKMQEFTNEHIKDRMAIVLDGLIKSAPVIQGRFGGQFRITGNFTEKEARDLSAVLTSGALPAKPELDSRITVGPALGKRQIESGVSATLLGAIAVALFMLLYYRLGGFLADACLLLNLALLLGVLGFFKATMTLPGIAGILLTMGMAVDANVLIFERIREERLRGRNLQQAVKHGFDRAFVTILDSQLTTLISGVILYAVGTGPVRGFAVTLSTGILVTLFANMWVCRLMVEWLVGRGAIDDLRMARLVKEPKFDFMRKRLPAFLLSGVLVASSVGLFFSAQDRIYDVDFTGGTLLEFNFGRGHGKKVAEVRAGVHGKLEPALKAHLRKVVGIIRKAAAEEKEPRLLQERLIRDLPEIGVEQFGSSAAVKPQAAAAFADKIDKVLAEYDKTPLDVDAPGSPDKQGRHRNFILITHRTEPYVRATLYDELLKLYGGELEPPAVELLPKDKKFPERLRIRFNLTNKEQLAAAEDREGLSLSNMVKREVGRLKDRKELEKLHPLVDGLEYSLPRREAYGDVERYVVDVSGLPKDRKMRDELVKVIGALSIPERSGGPIARFNTFGPQVAGEMKRTAVAAFLLAMAGIFIYLWFRFQFSGAWGFGALVALMHDAVIAVGALCFVSATGLLSIKIDLNVVAAVLSIVGYSVNDTIVVFDRIREMRAAHPTRDPVQVVNEAVNATLSRTLLTSFTTIMAVLSLFLFGGDTISDLSFTLLVGIVVGTYSSIFVASPAMLWWAKRYGFGRAPLPAVAGGKRGGVQI